MKKILFTVAILSSFVMCKKTESSTDFIENKTERVDSSLANAVLSEEKIQDSAQIKIKDFEEQPDHMHTADTIEMTLEELENADLKLITKENVPVEKRIVKTETLPNKTKRKNGSRQKTASKREENPAAMQLAGEVEISVKNLAESLKDLEYTMYSSGATLKTKSTLSGESRQKYAYYKMTVPTKNYELLSQNIAALGTVEREDRKISDGKVLNNSLSSLEVTMLENRDKTASDAHTASFGKRSFAALYSGWDWLSAVFIFFLPLWPLFLLAGGVYILVRKKQNKA